jgi:hypothetical protein
MDNRHEEEARIRREQAAILRRYRRHGFTDSLGGAILGIAVLAGAWLTVNLLIHFALMWVTGLDDTSAVIPIVSAIIVGWWAWRRMRRMRG